jgi:hypothetical protein
MKRAYPRRETHLLAAHFAAAAAGAPCTAALDLVARQLRAAHDEGCLSDADAEAIGEAVQVRRAALARGRRGVRHRGQPLTDLGRQTTLAL